MDNCPVCHHAKIQAIDAALDSGRSPRLVRHQYHLDWTSLEAHIAHHAAPHKHSIHEPLPGKALSYEPLQEKAYEDTGPRGGVLIQARGPLQVTENPFSQFKQAWHLAKDDPRLQQTMLAWLNEQLMNGDMG